MNIQEQIKELSAQENEIHKRIMELKAIQDMKNDLCRIKKIYNCSNEFLHYEIQLRRCYKEDYNKRFMTIASCETKEETINTLNDIIDLIRDIEQKFADNIRED